VELTVKDQDYLATADSGVCAGLSIMAPQWGEKMAQLAHLCDPANAFTKETLTRSERGYGTLRKTVSI